MFRLVFLTFFGEFRGTHEQEHHLHESPPSMTVPLWILAVARGRRRLVGLPERPPRASNCFHRFLEPVISSSPAIARLPSTS